MRRLWRFVVFFGTLSALLGGTHYYFFVRLIEGPALGETWLRVGAIGCAFLAVLTPGGMIAARTLPRPASTWIAGVSYTWLGVLFMLLMALWVSEIPRLLFASTIPEPRLSRILALSVVALVGGAAVWGLFSALGRVGIERVAVRLPKLHEDARGFKIVQLSDVHIGPMLGRAWLERVVAEVNALEPDAVAITGDLVDGPVSRLREHVAPLAELKAKHGVFFVTGNHEYYSGADSWIAELRRLGITVLRNERVELDGGLDIAGVDDWTAFGKGHGPDLDAALAGRDEDREVVLLAHQPRQIDEAASRGVGLMLSGHTHGGQIFPWNFFVRLQQPYVAGLVRHGEAQLYVSRGTGYWGPPLRVGAPPEITLLELEPASS